MLAALVVGYFAYFGTMTWIHHRSYGTFGFDMGINDQGIWLMSRFEEPFVTIRGLNYLGHHVNVIAFLLVPLYWLGAGPESLYLVQTAALAVAAVPVWLLARDHLGGGWASLVPAAAFLLNPAIQWITWWHFHPEALAVAPLLFAWWFARHRRWGWFSVMIALALSTKEDVALAVFMLGLLLLVRRPRRPGLLTAVAGLAWFVIATRVWIPAFNSGRSPFYAAEIFPQFGNSTGSVIWGIITSPGLVLELVTEEGRLRYYRELLWPVGFVSLMGWPFLLIAAPQVAINVLSSNPLTHSIRYQYAAVPMVAVFVALAEGLGFLRRWRTWAPRAALVAVAACAVWANVALSPSPLGDEYYVWAKPQPRHRAMDDAIAMVPPEAGVSANYHLVTHLSHRRHVYEWPNPWMVSNWGMQGDPGPPTTVVDYLVLDLTFGQQPALLATLTGSEGEFDVLFERDGVLVARRRGR